MQDIQQRTAKQQTKGEINRKSGYTSIIPIRTIRRVLGTITTKQTNKQTSNKADNKETKQQERRSRLPNTKKIGRRIQRLINERLEEWSAGADKL
jgi:hypothetical protein